MKSIFIIPVLAIIFILSSRCSRESVKEDNIVTNTGYIEISGEKKTVGTHRIIIAPFDYKKSSSIYPNPLIFRTIVFNSFYSFFSLIPKIDIPDKTVLNDISVREESIAEISERYNCDFIIFGDYELNGMKENPNAAVSMKIWSRITGEILTNESNIPTDVDIFDSIDNLRLSDC